MAIKLFQQQPKCLVTIGAVLKNFTFYVKTAVATFWATLGHFLLQHLDTMIVVKLPVGYTALKLGQYVCFNGAFHSGKFALKVSKILQL